MVLLEYEMSDEEQEWVLFCVLKRLYFNDKKVPSWHQKRRNFAVYGRINKVYGDQCAHKAQRQLTQMGLLQINGNTVKATKYAIWISILALALSLTQAVIMLFKQGN